MNYQLLKNTLTFVLISLIAVSAESAFAQKGVTLLPTKKASVKFGPEEKGKKTWINSVIGSVGNDTYTFRYVRKGGLFSRPEVHLDKVSKSLKTTKTMVAYDKEIRKGRKSLLGSIIANEHLYLVYNRKLGKSKKSKSKVMIQEVNLKSMRLEKAKVSLDVFSNNPNAIVSFYGIGLSKRVDELVESGFDVSNDGSKILIYQSTYSTKKSENEDISFFVYDEKFDLIWEKEIQLPYSSELFSVQDVLVDNEGNVHLLAKEYKEKRKDRRKGQPNYKYHVMSYFDAGNDVKDNIISLGQDYITDISLNVTNGNMVSAGFYSEKAKFSSIKGVFYMNMDLKSQKLISKSTKEFSIDFMVQNMKEGKAKRTKNKSKKGKNVEMYQFDLDEIITREDGGTVMLAEQYYVTTHVSVDSKGNTRTYYVYHHDDIIAVSVSPEGDIEWAERVPKLQSSRAPNGPLSYASAMCGDKLYLVFNDNSKNITSPRKGRAYPYKGLLSKKSIVTVVEIDGAGNVSREVLYKPGKQDIILHPTVSDNVKDCELFLYNRRGKKHQYSQVTFH